MSSFRCKSIAPVILEDRRIIVAREAATVLRMQQIAGQRQQLAG